ncbi:MAG: YybH family protein [Gemmatimonadota bacterium]
MTRWISALALLVALVGCADGEGERRDATSSAAAAGASAADRSDVDGRRALEAELVAADRDFARSVAEHGLAGWLSGFAPSGRMIAGGESFIGREGIRRTMLPLFADTTLAITRDPTYAEVAESGDLGYTVGRYEVSAEGEAAWRAETGTYMTVWTRLTDGSWKVKADIANPDRPDRTER